MGFAPIAAQTDESGDLLYKSLDSVVVSGHRVSSSLQSAKGQAVWNMNMMNELPKILGNADPMHYTQLLPSVQTNNEYDGGFHVQGCDNGHNYVSVEGVPLYNVAHLMGFFSVFNASHYKSLQLHNSTTKASDPNRLGGILTMHLTDSVVEKTEGEFSVGIISSQGTLRLPLGKRQQLTVSLRASYLNLLYSQWLKIDGSQMKYSFHDANVSYIYKHDSASRFMIDCYMGSDAGRIGMGDYGAVVDAEWGNRYVAAHWEKAFRGKRMKHTLYNTYYRNRYTLEMSSVDVALPSSVNDIGYKGELHSGLSHLGIDAVYHTIRPQSPDVKSGYYASSALSSAERIESVEASAYYDIKIPLSQKLKLEPGLRATIYGVKGNAHYSLDPVASLTWQTGARWSHRVGFASRHQYLLQTGITSLGLPTTFWLSTATDGIPVQSQQCISLATDGKFLRGRYSVSVELYYKWLQHQQEYFGTFYDFLNTSYDIHKMLHHGRGRNYGINLTINKLKGSLTGWLSYSYGRSQRQLSDIGGGTWFPSNHERMHELNGVANRKLGDRWSIGLTGVYAMGTPFTAPRNFHIINGNIISSYGEHNANRLTPYFRIDMSVNYRLKPTWQKESGINFSLYNVTFSENKIFYYVKLFGGKYYYHGASFFTKLLPSVSYYCRF